MRRNKGKNEQYKITQTIVKAKRVYNAFTNSILNAETKNYANNSPGN
jgi:hypothetical protein